MKPLPVGVATILFLLARAAATGAQPAPPPAPATVAGLSAAFERLVERVSPAVVQVFATSYATPSDEEESSSLVTTERTTGSGVVLDPNGYIVTNAHVVEGVIRL
jgi:serine protease Do